VISQAVADLEPLLPVKAACELVGQPRSTLYRRRNPRPGGEERQASRPAHPAALSLAERAQLLAVLDGQRFADKSPAQVWAILLDEGTYLASVSTMYRVLRAEGQVRERRAQAAHPPRVRPELVATGPSQVWSWDITKLKGPWRGIWFDLYVMLDIFSRKAIWQEVHATENGDLATAFIENAIAANSGIAPGGIHADNGTSMTSKTVTDLLADLKISAATPGPMYRMTTPIPKRSSRPSNTARPSPAASKRSARPATSATFSSPTTTTSTGTQASACTPRPPCTTAPPGPSRPAASTSSTRHTKPARSAFRASARKRPGCPPRSGSTSPARPSRPRRRHKQTQPPGWRSPGPLPLPLIWPWQPRRAARMSAAVIGVAHVLAPAEPTGAVVDVLHSRLVIDPDWGLQVTGLKDTYRRL